MRDTLRAVVLLGVIAAGCGRMGAEATGCDGEPIRGGTTAVCEVPGWPDRLAEVHVPEGYTPDGDWPVIVAFHGGGGTRESAAKTTCPDGDLSHPECLHGLGDRVGFLTVYPDGVPAGALGRIRTWNAGGSGDLDCVAGTACEQMSDDVGYVADLLDLLGAHYSVEPRVTVTGLSNGGAMAHRLGCDLADRVKVVAAVGGANQQPGCEPSQPVSILQIHGTRDPCWPYEGGELGGCGGGTGRITGAEDTIDGWIETLDCGPPTASTLPDGADDGMESLRLDHECDGATVTLIMVDGGGHTWPDGHQYAPERRVGGVTHDFSGNQVIWGFAVQAEG